MPEDLPSETEATVVLGNFDGIHLGHRALVTRARAMGFARTRVLTFWPPPSSVLTGDAPPVLTTLERRVELLSDLGVDELCVQHFDRAFSRLTAAEFFESIVVAKLRARAVVAGENFRFGRDREGDSSRLRGLAERLGVAVAIEPTLESDGRAISSSRIRAALDVGDVSEAARLLGRSYDFDGIARPGDGRGKTLGFPTANLHEIKTQLPANGVYAVRARARGAWQPAIMNVGVRPTFSSTPELRVEVHLFDWAGGSLHGEALRVAPIARVRDERRFANADELVAQIGHDANAARAILRGEE